MTTLNEVKIFLESVDPTYVFSLGFNHPHSWRGYYSEVSFEPAYGHRAGDMLYSIDKAVSETFDGWKGGEYTYNLDNDAHLEAGGFGCYTETAAEDFTAMFEQMKNEWKAFNRDRVIIAPSTTKPEVKKMATKKRETAAQKRERLAAERAESLTLDYKLFREQYQSRLLQLVQLTLKVQPQMMSTSGDAFKFTFEWTEPMLFPVTLSAGDEVLALKAELEMAEEDVALLYEEQRLAEDRFAKKQAALSKLTQEEKELLGL
jgi:hypothetical protein